MTNPTIVVALIGVPFTYKSTRMPALYAAMALLVAGPLVLPRLRRRGRQVLAAALLILFGLPVLWVEYLTLRHGPELRAVYDAEAGPGSSEDALLFSVFDYSSERAKVLRVEGSSGKTFGYFLHFRRSEGRSFGEEVAGAWDVDIHPQVVLWSDAGSAFVACPYPTSVLLLLRGTGSFKC